MAEPMTGEEYVKQGAACCPWCRSKHFVVVEGSELEESSVPESADGVVRQAVEGLQCGDCGKYWFDVYRLMGYFEAYDGAPNADE